jgi:ABC-type thiamine transport system substrate-binding protein
MEMITNEIGKFAKKHEERLHVNVKATQLLDNSELVRRLKKKKKTSADGVITKSRAQ